MKQVPYFNGGVARLIDEQQLFEIRQREALLEASIRRQEAVERSTESPYDADDLKVN